jgi:hypothetical protein
MGGQWIGHEGRSRTPFMRKVEDSEDEALPRALSGPIIRRPLCSIGPSCLNHFFTSQLTVAASGNSSPTRTIVILIVKYPVIPCSIHSNWTVQERQRLRFSTPALSKCVENIMNESYDNMIDFENSDINTI